MRSLSAEPLEARQLLAADLFALTPTPALAAAEPSSSFAEIRAEGESGSSSSVLYLGIAHPRTVRTDPAASLTNAGLLVLADVASGAAVPWRAAGSAPPTAMRIPEGHGFSGLAVTTDGRLFATTSAGPGSTSELLELDPITGRVLSRRALAGGLGSFSVGDLAYHPGEQRLYALRSGDDGSPVQLYTIDPAAGSATAVATPAPLSTWQRGYGLAIDSSGTIFAAGLAADGTSVLFRGSTSTLVPLPEILTGLAAEPGTGRLLGTRAHRDEPAWVDPVTGALTPIALEEPPHGVAGDVAFHPAIRGAELAVLFQRDFEDGPGGFTADNSGGTLPGLWHYSVGRFADGLPNHTPIHNWYYGVHESSTGGGTYVLPDDHQGVLRSPPITLPDCGTSVASFSYLLGTRPEFDRDFVEFAVEIVDGSQPPRPVTLLSRAQRTLEQTGNRWLSATADLSPFVGQTIRLRFTFDTGDAVPYDPEGWYVDDVQVASIPVPGCRPALTVDKTSSTTDFDEVGDVLDYQYVVTNTGETPVSGPIQVQDDRIAQVVCPTVTELAMGASVTCTASTTATQADLDRGSVTNTASAIGRFEGNPVTSPGDSVTVPASQLPALSVAKSALTASFSSVGETIEYRYVVTNRGNVTLAGPFAIEDDRTDNATCPGSTSLAPGASLTCTATYTTVQADLDAGDVTNIARATTTFQGRPVISPPATATVLAPPAPAITLDKTSLATSYSTVGEQIEYRYLVTNSGNVTLGGPFSIDDDLAANATCPATAGLAPGASLTCTSSYTVRQSDLDRGTLTNHARASVTFRGTTVRSNPDSVMLIAEQNPNLSLEKSSLTASFSAVGERIDYRYVVTNRGNVTLPGPILVADDRVAAVTCPIGSIAPGESVTCNGQYTTTQADLDAGSVTNLARGITQFAGEEVQSPPASATVPAVRQPQLDLTKSANVASYDAVGAVITYDYVVTNTGNVTLSGPFVVADDQTLDETCPTIDRLAPQATIRCSATYTITQADLDRGSVTNLAVVTGQLNGTPVTSPPVSVTVDAVTRPALAVTKRATVDSYAAIGDVLTYEFVVTNAGNVTLPGPFTVEDDRASDEACPASASLAPQATITCTASYTVTQADLDAASVTNTAVARGSFQGAVVTSPPATATVPSRAVPALTIDKTSLTADFDAVGDALQYQYVITNSGPVTLSGPIRVTDDRVANVTCPATASLAPGGTVTCTGSDSAIQADLDRGSLTNVARGSATFRGETITSPPDTVTVPAVQQRELSVDKSASVTTYSTAGEVIRYEYVVTNRGNVTLSGPFAVRDDRATSVTCPNPATLAPGNTLTCSALYTVTAADVTAGFITNLARAVGSFDDTEVISPPDSVTVTARQTVQFITPLSVYRLNGLFVGEAGSPGNAPPGSNPGSIHGFKWHDVDQDGIWDAGEPGRAGWRIYLDLNHNNVFDAVDPSDPSRPPEPFAITQADGSFALTNLLPGTYTVREDRAGLSDGTFTIQAFPTPDATGQRDPDEHRVTVQAGQEVRGTAGVAMVPNFGSFDYSPLVRPADDHLGHLRANAAAGLTASVQPWQAFVIRNPRATPLQITGIDKSLIAAPGDRLVTVVQCDGSAASFPQTVPAQGSATFCAFYDPAVRDGGRVIEQFPDWFGESQASHPPHTFLPSDRLRVVTDSELAFHVELVGSSTFDSDITYDGSVDAFDAATLEDLLARTAGLSITPESAFFDPTKDINARCPNGAEGFVGDCQWPLSGPPRREIALGDFGPFNVELFSTIAPWLDLDADNSSGREGTGFVVTYVQPGVPVVDRDVQFANLNQFDLASIEVVLENPLDGDAERLEFRGQQGHRIVMADLGGGTGREISDFEQALQEIRYVNTRGTPNRAARVIRLTPQGSTDFARPAGIPARALVVFAEPPATTAAPAGEAGGTTLRTPTVAAIRTATDGSPESIASSSPWRNPSNPYDVNGVDGVTPLDVLALINYLNRHPDAAYLPEAGSELPFLDVNGDRYCTANDVLLVLNYLGSAAAQPAAEGEASGLETTALGETDKSKLPALPAIPARMISPTPPVAGVETGKSPAPPGADVTIIDELWRQHADDPLLLTE